jgi:hypothetical protein
MESEKLRAIEARREYILTDTAYTKCDLCKRFFAKAFDLTPVKKTHNFDNVVLCVNCLDKCQLIYNIDIRELIISGSVEEWLKKKV